MCIHLICRIKCFGITDQINSKLNSSFIELNRIPVDLHIFPNSINLKIAFELDNCKHGLYFVPLFGEFDSFSRRIICLIDSHRFQFQFQLNNNIDEKQMQSIKYSFQSKNDNIYGYLSQYLVGTHYRDDDFGFGCGSVVFFHQ